MSILFIFNYLPRILKVEKCMCVPIDVENFENLTSLCMLHFLGFFVFFFFFVCVLQYRVGW
jgi:hypothetical protein